MTPLRNDIMWAVQSRLHHMYCISGRMPYTTGFDPAGFNEVCIAIWSQCEID
jgi:hypothetical protein